jgi:NAD(P)-dependent dehydrogenase (short-subunit alcohol dehydrogenase family)
MEVAEMKDFKNKVVVVTGSASGIGREIARSFARRGARMALADIDPRGLEVIAEDLSSQGSEVYQQVVDVAVAEQVKDFCDGVYREMGRVDVLCNNAGVAVGGLMEHLDLEDWQWIVGVNLMGVIHGCNFFYPRMIEQGGGGHIVNTASLAGLIPAPGLIAYSTTKFAVVGLSQTLRYEAARHGIGVSVLCPGFVFTGISQSARIKSISEEASIEEQLERGEEILKRRKSTARTVAEKAVRAVEENKAVVKICSEAYIADLLYRLSRELYDFLSIHVLRPGRKMRANT